VSTSAASIGLPDSESVSRTVLPDGAILLVRENPASPAVVVQGAILAGAVDDPPDRPGLCRFTAECLTRGTQRRSAAELFELVESVGGSLGVGAGLHTVRFGAKCLSDDLQMIVELLSEVLHSPSFPAAEIEKVRGEILTELEERDNDTRSVTNLAFRKLAYPEDHPYSRPADGERETVAGFTRDDVRHFFDSLVRRRPAIISVVGNLRQDDVEKLFAPLWSTNARTANPAPLPDCTRRDGPRETYTVIPGKVQIDLAWGTIGPPRNHPDFVPASVANLILGGFGLMGRLGQKVREELGLAYYAASRVNAGLGAGPWVCVAGVAPEHYRKAVSAIEQEVAKLRETPVPQDELEDCKSHLIGSLPLKLESNEGVASIMSEIEIYRLGWDYLHRFADLVNSVTAEDINRVVRAYFEPDQAILAGSGPEVPG